MLEPTFDLRLKLVVAHRNTEVDRGTQTLYISRRTNFIYSDHRTTSCTTNHFSESCRNVCTTGRYVSGYRSDRNCSTADHRTSSGPSLDALRLLQIETLTNAEICIAAYGRASALRVKGRVRSRRVNGVDWILPSIGVQIQVVLAPNGISLEEPPQRRAVISSPVVIKARF